MDAAPVSSFLTATKNASYDMSAKYTFSNVLPAVSLGSAVARKQDQEPFTVDRLRSLYNVDGLCPRSWFSADIAALIDSQPGLCTVSHVENPPSTFWIRISSRADQFSELVEFMQQYCQNACFAQTDIPTGQIFAAELESFKENGWNCGMCV